MEFRSSGVAVTLVVHGHKRLGPGIGLAMLAGELKAGDVGLEFLTGELKAHAIGLVWCSRCWGLCRVWSARTSVSVPSKATSSPGGRGKSVGGVGVVGGSMPSVGLHLCGQEMSLRDVAEGLVITGGAKMGQCPSSVTVVGMLREDGEQAAMVVGA